MRLLKHEKQNVNSIPSQYWTRLLVDDDSQVIGSSSLGKAIKYTLGHWPKLIRYINEDHLSIDNNPAGHWQEELVVLEDIKW